MPHGVHGCRRCTLPYSNRRHICGGIYCIGKRSEPVERRRFSRRHRAPCSQTSRHRLTARHTIDGESEVCHGRRGIVAAVADTLIRSTRLREGCHAEVGRGVRPTNDDERHQIAARAISVAPTRRFPPRACPVFSARPLLPYVPQNHVSCVLFLEKAVRPVERARDIL